MSVPAASPDTVAMSNLDADNGERTSKITPIKLSARLDQQEQESFTVPIEAFRTGIVLQGAILGQLMGHFAKTSLILQPEWTEKVAPLMGELLYQTMQTARTVGINLAAACDRKIILNHKKYPPKESKGKSDKYTTYTNQTGITEKVGQEIGSLVGVVVEDHSSWWSTFATQELAELDERARNFVVERDFQQFHTPRNILLALSGEQGELAETVQFRGDDEWAVLDAEKMKDVVKEIADVSIYLFRLADESGVKLGEELKKQMSASS